jgi:hypothetical protein
VHYIPDGRGYSIAIEFKSIADAARFYSCPRVQTEYLEEGTVKPVDEEMQDVAKSMEGAEMYWKRRRRARKGDEDGYVTVL